MKSYSRTQLTDHSLLQGLATRRALDRDTAADLLADLGEVDFRKLYLPAAYPSMYLYCVHELGMSEDTALKRIQAARAARQFPAIFPAVADGRLHLSAVVLLAPHLEADTAGELLSAAEHKTMAELKRLLADRFPRPDVPTRVEPIAAPRALDIPEAGTGDGTAARPGDGISEQLDLNPVVPSTHSGALGSMEPLPPSVGSRARLEPLSPGRFALQVTLDQGTYDQLRYAQSLLGHAVPSGDVAEVLKRALDALVDKLEQKKFARSARSRPGRGTANGRYVPADVRRAVWERDGGRCTFVGENGRRCASTKRLEFDHVDEVARGGQTSVAGLRLRCRAHNQYTAEQTFGVVFMRGKREEARRRAERAKASTQAKASASEQARANARVQAEAKVQAQTAAGVEPASERDVIPWLRALGYNAEAARRGAANCAHIPEASLEERVKVACRSLARHCIRRPAPVVGSAP
jgi:5-methylcytosine-specific restriction endonuclease McrA